MAVIMRGPAGASPQRGRGRKEAGMTTSKVWSVEVSLTEDPERTRADAVLEVGGRQFRGFGLAKRNPVDPEVPRIGEELATARALSDLSNRLLHAAAQAIGAFEGHKVMLPALRQPQWTAATPLPERPARGRTWHGYLDEVGDPSHSTCGEEV
jgi:hypothetical protein